MEKRIITLFILLIITLSLMAPTILAADCPYDKVNCEYPGDCGRYIDQDNDNICDNSIIIPQESINLNSEPLKIKQSPPYHFFQIIIVLLILYLLTYSLSKFNYLKLITHRKIWNLLLLLTFLATSILGILLTIKINYGITINLPFKILFWHIEIGIAMATISIFHILWHWRYFKTYLKLKK